MFTVLAPAFQEVHKGNSVIKDTISDIKTHDFL